MTAYFYRLNQPAQKTVKPQTPDQAAQAAAEQEHIPASIVAANLITKLGQMLVARLAPASQEPTITETVELDGQRWWSVYDPYAGRSHWFASEAEAMVWLDTHRYR